jgi:hypothetical protein
MSSLMMNKMLGLSLFAMQLPFQEFMLSVTGRAPRRLSGISDLASVPKTLARTTVNRQVVSAVSFVARGAGGGHLTTGERGNPDTSGRS